MRSIFRYPGGKSKVSGRIMKYFPAAFTEYREPFVGGGGIFFELLGPKVRWINDIHPGLISVYTALKDRPDDFIKSCKDIAPESSPQDVDRLEVVFNELLKSDNEALKYFFINRTVWAGRVNYKIPSRLYYSNPPGWNIVKKNILHEAANHIKGTKITCVDFSELFCDGDDVFIYCDPPYVSNTKMPKTDQQYEYNFTLDDHERFVTLALRSKHKICISYDDCEEVRYWFENSAFSIYPEQWVYSGTSSSTKEHGRELIITNY